jgi:hypothetical protein
LWIIASSVWQQRQKAWMSSSSVLAPCHRGRNLGTRRPRPERPGGREALTRSDQRDVLSDTASGVAQPACSRSAFG